MRWMLVPMIVRARRTVHAGRHMKIPVACCRGGEGARLGQAGGARRTAWRTTRVSMSPGSNGTAVLSPRPRSWAAQGLDLR